MARFGWATVEIDDDDIIQWVKDNCNPDDVFDIETLKDWAECNGYVEGED